LTAATARQTPQAKEFRVVTNVLAVNPDRLWASLERSAEIGRFRDVGLRRLALSAEDKEMRDLFVEWARAAGFGVHREGFADRGYRADGSLVPRSEPGALLGDPEEVAARAVRVAREGRLAAVDGTEVALEIDTLCLHGDTPGAAARARVLRDALERAGVDVRAARLP